MSTSATHPRLSLAIRLAPFVTSAAVAALGVFVLVGWQLDVEFLKSLLHPGKVAMNPATAVCFILLAAAVWLVAKFPTPQRRMTIARGLACVVAGVALVRMCGYVAGGDFLVDRLLFRSKLGDNVMAPNTAIAFWLTAFSLLVLDVHTPRRRLH